MGQLRWREAISTVLRDSARPMHYADIAQAIIDSGYRTSVGATPAATVAANISQPPLRNQVTRVSVGVYALNSPSEPAPPAADSPHDAVERDAQPDAVAPPKIRKRWGSSTPWACSGGVVR